jgi:hypothetical protein
MKSVEPRHHSESASGGGNYIWLHGAKRPHGHCARAPEAGTGDMRGRVSLLRKFVARILELYGRHTRVPLE